ncbi:MAG: HAD-IC family P-type ATPase [Magnetospirillum sp.]|nr:HAD-IC family P-type ATPase [Magnetospirillum sp.]
MTAAAPSASVPMEVIHSAVPGRVRLRIPALRRDREAARFLMRELTRAPAILSLSANPVTGSLLIYYDPFRPLPDILDDVAKAARGDMPSRPAGAEAGNAPWHSLPIGDALALVGGPSPKGLSWPESQRRLARHGRNRLPLPRRRGFASILGGQFTSLPVMLLMASAVISLLTANPFEGIAILMVVGLNGMIGAVSEAQAEAMIARLESRRRLLAVVRRDGRQTSLDAEEIVPGDILLLSPGLTIAADARLIETDDFATDESVLTGESMPVVKAADTVLPAHMPLSDRANMVWRGTLAASGTAIAVTVATGRETEIGRIQTLVGDVSRPQTPLQRQLDALGRRLVLGSAAAALAMVGLGMLRGQGLALMLRAGAALAVAAIPEGLPTVATLSLALAVRDLERRGVLVRRLEAVEAIGAVATIFFDKTGTLTLNRMAVAQARVDGAAAGERLWQVAALCSDASIQPAAGGGWVVEGSSTETALVRTALDCGIDVPALRRTHPRLSERYRDDRRQSMATIHDLGQGRRLIAVKGSPAEVLAACSGHLVAGVGGGSHRVPLSDADRVRIAAENGAMASEGLRVLGFAFDEDADGCTDEQHLTWLGLVALSDPLRPGAENFVAALHRAGIETVMLTGDQAATARAVAARLKLSDGAEEPVADSAMVDTLDAEALAEMAHRTRVFARILPSHKLKVVQAYRRDGRVVAMVGDGINDGPALKAADVGVTMGRHGSRAARDLSDLVLEEDDLGGLLSAIEHGRTTHVNIRKAVDFMIATNVSEILVMLAATGLGLGTPLGPAQLLWINLVTDVLPGLALSREAPEAGTLERPPPDANAPFLDRSNVGHLLRQAAVLAAGPLAAHVWGLARGDGDRAASMTSTTMVAGQLLHALTVRSRYHEGVPPPNPWLTGAVAGTLALQGAAVTLPWLRRLLGLAPLGATDLAGAAAAALVPWLINRA